MEKCFEQNHAVPFAAHNTCATAAEKRCAADFYMALLDDPALFPCSFALGGKVHHGFADGFEPAGRSRTDSEFCRHDTLRFRHKSGLTCRVECALYPGYAACEWTLYFKNEGETDSPRLSSVCAADLVFPGQNPRLRGILGDARNEDYGPGDGVISPTGGMNYQPYEVPLALGMPYELHDSGGCACNHEFPYFKLQLRQGGAALAVGWPGHWKAGFRADRNGVHYTAGQNDLDTFLRPGEELRTPLAAFLLWDGDDADRETNLWRHFFMDCNMPRKNGFIPQPVLAASSFGTGMMTAATEADQIAQIRAYRAAGIRLDTWWMDAGWYTTDVEGNGPRVEDDYAFTGTWAVRENDFPTRLRAVSDCMAEQGGGTLLWFEPERCGLFPGTLKTDGSTLKREWLLKGYEELTRPRPDGTVQLPVSFVNLGNPEAYAWLKNRIFSVLEEGRISVYREDHNIRPLDFWRKTDEPGRTGMTENAYITAHLRLWDELREHFGGMVLDSCASGGRRNDLESVRRAVPLNTSDFFNSDLTRHQSMHHALLQWFPYFKGPATEDGRFGPDFAYQVRSAYAGWLKLRIDFTHFTGEQKACLRALTEEWRSIAPYYYDDYYPLLSWNIDDGQWLAFEFFDPASEEGVILAYRRPLCGSAVQRVPLKGLELRHRYRVRRLGGGTETAAEADGEALMRDGARLVLSGKPDAAVWKIEPAD